MSKEVKGFVVNGLEKILVRGKIMNLIIQADVQVNKGLLEWSDVPGEFGVSEPSESFKELFYELNQLSPLLDATGKDIINDITGKAAHVGNIIASKMDAINMYIDDVISSLVFLYMYYGGDVSNFEEEATRVSEFVLRCARHILKGTSKNYSAKMLLESAKQLYVGDMLQRSHRQGDK